ncbi:hypothetical protein HZB88_01945 [archaeon]|nr:hypothetical protein [archaeon]
MGCIKLREMLIMFFLVLVFALALGFVSATNCWTYTTQSQCGADASCTWKNDSWGSWCQDLNCWSFNTQSDCQTVSVPGKNCTWNSGTTYNWCEEINCWTFTGTNASACVNTTATINKSCTWRGECMNNGADWTVNCWSYTTQASCTNLTACSWGTCNMKSCWDYTSSSTCTAQTGSNGRNCSWNEQYDYCYQGGCWDYANQTSCLTAPSSLKCVWENSYCHEASCWDFSATNASACANNTANLSCNWNSAWNYCETKGCWNYATKANCDTQSFTCSWKTYTSGGWCEEVNCWTWDSYRGGNESSCVNNTYSMQCAWSGYPAGNTTSGWCYQNISTTQSCANKTSERTCLDTYYCFWDSGSSLCKNPSELTNITQTVYTEWNPGCYVFDRNSTTCAKMFGCLYDASTGTCTSNATIQSNGLTCTNINDSTLCNNIFILSSCCSWQGSSCTTNRYSTACYDQAADPPEGARFCDDTNSYTSNSICNQIADDPWYMPCKWSNTTERCELKMSDVFVNETTSLVKIDNKKTCESAGGKWIVENYCAGSISVPAGRCEYKFDEEKNCDKACFACEYKSDGTAYSSSADTKKACINSKLGYCEFTADTTAPNGYGYCKAKDEFKKGMATDCSTDCGTCTFKGDPQAAEESNTPKYYCENSKANCKWISDTVYSNDQSKGYCAGNAEKTCNDNCDKCYTQDACNQRLSNCSWDSSLLMCKVASGADQLEICWDGIDNNNDGRIDCSDSMCFSDPFCGGASMISTKNCFIYTTNATCTNNNCSWMNETWGSSCGMPGSNCYKYDGSQAQCLTNNATCDWHSGFGGFCEQDWSLSGTCSSLNHDSCTGAQGQTNNCTWIVDTWCQSSGGWCSGSNYSCSFEPYYSNRTLCTSNTDCYWTNSTYCQDQSGGRCDHKRSACWTHSSQPICENTSNTAWCRWEIDPYYYGGGWCESKGGADCYSLQSSDACATAGCVWEAGFCDPKGFGGEMMSGMGSGGGEASGGYATTCYKYNGNQSGCQNQSSCGWLPESAPRCDVNQAPDCPQYSYNATVCDSLQGCKWTNSTGATGWCDYAAFGICHNSTHLYNQDSCSNESRCTWKTWAYGGSCEPACSDASLTTSASCTTKNVSGASSNLGSRLCSWVSGWCNPAMATQMYTGVVLGTPVMLGFDTADGTETSPASIDISGFGMKDMGDSYGFGIGVNNFRNSSVCNGVKFKSDGTVGKGTDTGKFYWYLDTDGLTSGNCALQHDSTMVGYEFYFRYISNWSLSTGEAVETLNAYKCVGGNWGPADIKMSTWKDFMCNEIQGAMIAVDKEDLKKVSSLYNSSADMRIFVATANATRNITGPSDTAGPSWTTPGAVDFEINDVFAYGADMAKFEDILKKGFVKYEDCFNSIDDDKDGNIDCWDWDCQFAKVCTGLGVNTKTDTRAPQVVGVKIEEYPDAALIMFDTNKPTNGTLILYGADSACSVTANDTTSSSHFFSNVYVLPDVGITSSNVRQYNLWHSVNIYDGAALLASNGTSQKHEWPLANGAHYYYKLKVCDSNGKCAISKCSNFTTPSSSATCAYCDFVTRIKAPSEWDIYYDVDQDGTYEHKQGAVCGSNAGMKTNYSDGRFVNIKLNKNDSSVYFEFINATLTKTALNDKVRTISGSEDIVYSSTAGYLGLPAQTRDKIINNLRPEICKIKIPYSGTCDKLYHCDDSGANCIDRTSEATLLDATNCVWQIPYCEFSTYRESTTAATTAAAAAAGGAGGAAGGKAAACTESWSCSEWSACIDGTQTRTCTDAEDCGTAIDKPAETKLCEAEAEEEALPSAEEKPIAKKIKGALSKISASPIFPFAVIGLIIAIAIVLGAVLFTKRKKPKKFY